MAADVPKSRNPNVCAVTLTHLLLITLPLHPLITLLGVLWGQDQDQAVCSIAITIMAIMGVRAKLAVIEKEEKEEISLVYLHVIRYYYVNRRNWLRKSGHA